MLRISAINDSDQDIQFQLEGKLIGPWVDELRRLSEAALLQGKKVSLDLDKLRFVDVQGVALLHDLSEKQVSHFNCSPFISQQLKEAAQ